MNCLLRAAIVFPLAMILPGCAEPAARTPAQGPTAAAAATEAATTTTEDAGENIGGMAPRKIIALFGARLEDGVTDRQMAGYRRVFGFGDRDRDGRHSRREYVDEGRYMTRQARQGIFRAADSDGDGFVTRQEYVRNRIITDEAKLIFEDMDLDRNGRVTRDEFMANGRVEDQDLCAAVFKALDTNGDGALIIPEYLRVWGRWARS